MHGNCETQWPLSFVLFRTHALVFMWTIWVWLIVFLLLSSSFFLFYIFALSGNKNCKKVKKKCFCLNPASLWACVDWQLSKLLPDYSWGLALWTSSVWVMTSQQQARMLLKTFPAGKKLPFWDGTGWVSRARASVSTYEAKNSKWDNLCA